MISRESFAMRKTSFGLALFAAVMLVPANRECAAQVGIHTWETYEITLTAQNAYANPYMEVDVWAQLSGPNFNKKIWGFWDGADTFKIRILATEPGTWTFTTGAADSAGKALTDAGLVGKTGTFTAVDWTEAEKQANPNRRGTVRATPNGRAWQYADGTPFFMLAETQWAATTWRIPFTKSIASPDYSPLASNWSFEGSVQWLRKLGFNAMAMIAVHPNWHDDGYAAGLSDNAGVVIRDAKPKSGTSTARDMHDEDGNRPFLLPGLSSGRTDVCANFYKINPAYFKNMDRKMDCMKANGFVAYVESVRRDHGWTWMKYYKWPGSFAKFLNYLQARYGTHSMILSLLHFDTAENSIPPSDWRSAMNAWFQKYGPMPFGQAVTIMGGSSSLANFGHVDKCPWLQAHAVGNAPKDHGMELNLAACFSAVPPVPCFCNEPYYVNFNGSNNACGGEIPPPNSYRDNYLARAHAYGHVLNGGLAGHIVGTGSRWGNAVGEPADVGYPVGWETEKYPFMLQAHFLRDFIFSEGLKYRDLQLASDGLSARRAPGSLDASLDGWSHMMRTADKTLAFIYFENKAVRQTISGMTATTAYKAQWFNPRTGAWSDVGTGILTSDAAGRMTTPNFPNNVAVADSDWALKLVNGSVSIKLPRQTSGPDGSFSMVCRKHALEIAVPGSQRMSVRILTIAGRAVITNGETGSAVRVDTRSIVPGIYLVAATTERGTSMQKVIVK